MRTRSQTRNRNRQQQSQPAVVQPFHLEEPFVNPPLVPMADNRTMAQLLQAPTEGYEDAIVIPEINANFELKHGLINLVQNKQFFGHDKEDPHAHIRYFNKITSTMRFPDVPSTSIKLMLFPFSLEGSARIWLEKEPPRSILTWDDLVSKFINQFFPPSKTTNLRNEITRFQQRFDESFYEAWDRFNDLLRACPHHGFSELHQLDTFYNALNANDQDSLNSAAGGNFLDKMPRECLRIIESKSKVRNSRNKAVVAKVSSNSSTPGISPDVAALTTEVSKLKNLMKTMLIDKQKAQAPASVKAVEQNCVTCVSKIDFENYVKANDDVLWNMQNQGQGLENQMTNLTEMISKFITSNTASSSNSGTLPSQTVTNPREHVNAITTRSVQKPRSENTAQVPPPEDHDSILIEIPKPKAKKTVQEPNFPEPSRYQTYTSISRQRTSALADSGASINLLPHSIYKQLGLGALTPTRMTLELANHSITHPMGIAEDVVVRVDGFTFLADFVVVTFKKPDPRVPIILGRPFLRTAKSLIDLYEEKLTLELERA
ncbi:reverse transcriptase domain-containing protein [Tanacetum coccineum]